MTRDSLAAGIVTLTTMNAPQFENTYTRLSADAYALFAADPVAAPRLLRANRTLAAELGIDSDWLESAEGIAVLAGNEAPHGSTPIAAAYAGHQFGHWNPMLGDGRAALLGEVVRADGQRFDIQLKGSGPTPYARGGDGRAPIGPVLREYIVAEAMAAMDVPTTRALAAVATGETVYREAPSPGGVLVRVASSHIRVGTVQYFAMLGNVDALRELLDYVIERHYPDLAGSEHPYLALLSEVQRRQAELIAKWQLLGFIHGVMNTDNMLLCGETIDYGPCAFLDTYQPDKVFSSIDHGGRYAYQNQPSIAHWNICRLAEAMLPLIANDKERAVELATDVIERFPAQFETAWETGLATKIGLDGEQGATLGRELLALMAESGLDFTLTFRTLTERAANERSALHLDLPRALDDWLKRWMALAPDAARMKTANPSIIPRNHQIEAIIAAAVQTGDLTPFHDLVDALANPFANDPPAQYTAPPAPEEEVTLTFCGT